MNQTKFCQWCGNEGSDEHHLFRRSTEPRLIDDNNNKAVLCRRCHDYATNVKSFEQLLQEKLFLKQEKQVTLKLIQEAMRSQETMSPKEVTDYRRFLAGEYSYLSEMLEWVIKNKSSTWLELRKECKSDNQAEKRWSLTEAGVKEKELKSKLKRCEKLMSSLRTIFELFQREAQNIF